MALDQWNHHETIYDLVYEPSNSSLFLPTFTLPFLSAIPSIVSHPIRVLVVQYNSEKWQGKPTGSFLVSLDNSKVRCANSENLVVSDVKLINT